MQRSEILAANLANEDTPGFQARDIDFAAEMRRLEHAPAGEPGRHTSTSARGMAARRPLSHGSGLVSVQQKLM